LNLVPAKLAAVATTDKIIVEKSTLPVRNRWGIKIYSFHYGKRRKFQVLSNPEFLAEGTAVRDPTTASEF
jgi:UDPglucose 6-dehydrogenase